VRLGDGGRVVQPVDRVRDHDGPRVDLLEQRPDRRLVDGVIELLAVRDRVDRIDALAVQVVGEPVDVAADHRDVKVATPRVGDRGRP